MQCVMRHDGCIIAEKRALELNNFAIKVGSIVCRDPSFIAKVRSVTNLSATVAEEHFVSFFTARKEVTIGDMDLNDFLSSVSPQTYQCYIRMTKFLLQRPNIPSIFEDID